MTQTIKVRRITMDMVDVKEVDLDEARELMEEAYTQGMLVIDKDTGDVVDEITSNTKEIFLVGVLGGG